MIQTKTQRKHMYTPLRYPGGKTSLFEFFDQVIQRHGWGNVKYIEPYAGGAGAGLSLLVLGKVESIVINDFDPAIYAFWKSILDNPKEFIRLIEITPVTISEWNKQKLVYKIADQSDLLNLGFATFFLNRTNRSGVMNAGPIGGKNQTGNWKIDARYNKTKLIEKIETIAKYRHKITVSMLDGVDVVAKYANDPHSFFYVDPPYFVKGAHLYLNAFDIKDHEKLARTLNQYTDTKWLLTYDNEPEIRELYAERNYMPFDLKYSVHHNTHSGSEIMFLSDAVDMDIIDSIE